MPIEAYALVWPNDPRVLLFNEREQAEENRRWFTKNFKRDKNGNERGEPRVVRLVADSHPLQPIDIDLQHSEPESQSNGELF